MCIIWVLEDENDYTIFEGDNGKVLTKEQAEYLADLSSKYPIISIEDGMDENDWLVTFDSNMRW